MRASGIFGLLFGGSDDDKAADREAIRAEVEAEVDFIFDTAQNRIAERRERIREATMIEPLRIEEDTNVIGVKAVDIDNLHADELREYAASVGVEFHHKHNDESIRRLIMEINA